MKLIIAGGRSYKFTSKDIELLDEITTRQHVSEIVSGGATGADAEGEKYARENGISIKRFPADWSQGPKAGPIRNRKMAEYADALVAFPGGRGTANMIQEATKRGLKIYQP